MGKVTGAVHKKDGPRVAPAVAYVPIAEGSSSAAPVISPSPTERKVPCGTGLGAPVLLRSSTPGSCFRRSPGTWTWVAMYSVQRFLVKAYAHNNQQNCPQKLQPLNRIIRLNDQSQAGPISGGGGLPKSTKTD